MKTALDPRHKRRQRLIQELFRVQFQKQTINKDANEVMKYKDSLDSNIHKAAPDFPVDKINKIDLAILRLSTYELLVIHKEPQNVIIDEAVELAKEFGNDSSPAFINGVLGRIVTYGKLA